MHQNGSCKCCKGHSKAIISGIAFLLIAVLHIVRSALGWPVIIDGTDYPIWASILCAVVAGLLGVWNLCCGCCKKKCCSKKKCTDPTCRDQAHCHDTRCDLPHK